MTTTMHDVWYKYSLLRQIWVNNFINKFIISIKNEIDWLNMNDVIVTFLLHQD